MTYPNNIDYFVAKIDKNASGWYVSGENFNVPSSPYTLYLDHVPKDSATTTILPSGGGTPWTEDFTGSPAAGEYYVDYDVGRLLFNSGDIGTALEAQYETLGDDIMAEHVNYLQLAASGVERELGLGCRGSFQNVSQRLDSFMTIGSSISASQVNILTPPGLSATTVQEFIDASGTAVRSDTNPFGIGWQDIYNADGDMVRAQNNITTGYLYANTISASGNQIGINTTGPDADSWLYFYDGGSPIGQWIKWDEGSSRFELSTDLYVHGNVDASGGMTNTFLDLTDTPGSYVGMAASGVRVNPGASGIEFYDISGSGGGTSDHDLLNNLAWSVAGHTIDANIVPTASGTQSVGTAPVAFAEGHFDNLYTNYIYGDGSNLTNIVTGGGGYVHIQSSPSVAWIVDHNLGTDDVIVQVADNSAPPLQVIPTEIEYTNINRVTITFSEAEAGQAMVVTASGAPGGGGGLDELVKASSTDPTAGYLDAKIKDSLEVNAQQVRLVNDNAAPGNNQYYGTDGGGTKGYFALPVTSAANPALSNLAAVAINASLAPGSDNAIDVGTSANGYTSMFLSDANVASPATNGEIRYNNSTNQFEFYQNGGVVALGAGANTALSNLAAVAINTSLAPGADNNIDLGTATNGARAIYLSDANVTAPSTNGEVRYNNSTNKFEFYENGAVVNLGSGVGPASVGQAELKTTTIYQQMNNGVINVTLTQEYAFFPLYSTSAGTSTLTMGQAVGSTLSHKMQVSNSGNWNTFQQRYVTASGPDNWIFLLLTKGTNTIIGAYVSEDHPSGMRYKTTERTHPFDDFDPETQDIAVIDNGIFNIAKKLVTRDKTIIDVITQDCEIDTETTPTYSPRKCHKINEFPDDPFGPVIKTIPVPAWMGNWAKGTHITIEEETVSKLPAGFLYKAMKLKA